jgi:hypothetical protein
VESGIGVIGDSALALNNSDSVLGQATKKDNGTIDFLYSIRIYDYYDFSAGDSILLDWTL